MMATPCSSEPPAAWTSRWRSTPYRTRRRTPWLSSPWAYPLRFGRQVARMQRGTASLRQVRSQGVTLGRRSGRPRFRAMPALVTCRPRKMPCPATRPEPAMRFQMGGASSPMTWDTSNCSPPTRRSTSRSYRPAGDASGTDGAGMEASPTCRDSCTTGHPEASWMEFSSLGRQARHRGWRLASAREADRRP